MVRTARLDEDDIRDLFGAFYRAQSHMPCEPRMVTDARTGEMSLEETVGNCDANARSVVRPVIGNDLPTTSIEVTIDGKAFTYGGIFGTPEELDELEKRLRSLE